jgi:hypothetical protein
MCLQYMAVIAQRLLVIVVIWAAIRQRHNMIDLRSDAQDAIRQALLTDSTVTSHDPRPIGYGCPSPLTISHTGIL